jgi:hypothetical protein
LGLSRGVRKPCCGGLEAGPPQAGLRRGLLVESGLTEVPRWASEVLQILDRCGPGGVPAGIPVGRRLSFIDFLVQKLTCIPPPG